MMTKPPQRITQFGGPPEPGSRNVERFYGRCLKMDDKVGSERSLREMAADLEEAIREWDQFVTELHLLGNTLGGKTDDH